MAQGVPRPADLPPGPTRDLVLALHDLYRAAGMPSMRMISTAIRQRNDLPDTVSHETVGQMLRGEAVPGWIKLECVVRQLAALAIHRPDVESEVKRFHELWLPAFSGTPGAPSPAVAAPPHALVEPPAPAADLVGDVPARNIRFVGREHLIQTVHEILRTGAQVVTLNGIGGVGKTQLAIEYLHRFQDQYEFVWWIPAEHPSQLRASLAELGTRLHLPRSEAMQHPPAQVLDALARGERRFLLVFDNAGRPSRLPPLTTLGPGRVLITSRDPDWTYHGSHLEVGVFRREESVRLLRDRAHLGAADAELVAEKLGDLPLAVDQVALHLATGVPVGAFLDDLDQQLQAVLSDPRGKARSYPATVPGFLNVAFTQLADSAPAAAQLLELFAWVGAEPLSLALLRSGRQGTVTSPLREVVRHAPTLNSAVKDLRRHGLVAVIDGDPVRIQVHRVFQRVLKDWLGEIRLARGRANIQAILAAANPGEPDDSRFWGHYAEVSPHVIAADLATATEFEVRRVALDQVRYLFRIGHYQESRALGERLVSASPSGGSSDADHHFYVLVRHHLGNVLRMLGDYAAAKQVTLDALEYLDSHPEFGPQQEYIADLEKNRAADLRISGEYGRALTVDKASLRRLRNDDDDEDRIRTIHSNIAVSYRLLGRFDEAYDIDKEIVRWRTAIRGAQDPRTLFARSNLARDLFGLGRYADARNEVRAVLPAYRTVVGENHHGVLLAVRTEVMALRKLGDAWDAAQLAEQNREDLNTWFGARHEHTLAAGISLVNARLAVRDLGTAAVEAPKLFGGCAELFGEEHPMTLAVAVNWASVLRALGDVHGAQRQDKEAAGKLRRVLGEEHPYTLCAEHNLAVDLAMLGQNDEATVEFRSVLGRSMRVRGDSHPDTLACAANVSGERKQWVECDIEPPPA
ncbi:MAG TPA: FxSxx-COOH system tetratricopeptide repeat protein [Actinophytocola sp.]|uniref:FxSxx-COOH system tetratricopeptide repeat protein n=1 Tax=Actinophytocola sp. TaxID=1872138 RepID=UPI002DFCDA52|nr:FxSxx-COOH system tetratricopeptide repeat protein [Actinophytocola sp.]